METFEPVGDSSMSQSQDLSNDDVMRWAVDSLLQAEDNLLDTLPIPIKKGYQENDFENADDDALKRIAFNFSVINSIRLRTCRLLLSAGLPMLALQEFESLTALTFDELDSFYRALSVSLGARLCHNWYVSRAESISRFFSALDEESLAKNHKLFTATCIECALLDKEYEFAATIADSCDSRAPFEVRLLEWICIAYWLVPSRNADAGKWSEIAIANRCPSQYPYIVKCRSLLAMGDFGEAVECLDQAERFFYSIGHKEAYAAILQERSGLMDNAAPP